MTSLLAVGRQPVGFFARARPRSTGPSRPARVAGSDCATSSTGSGPRALAAPNGRPPGRPTRPGRVRASGRGSGRASGPRGPVRSGASGFGAKRSRDTSLGSLAAPLAADRVGAAAAAGRISLAVAALEAVAATRSAPIRAATEARCSGTSRRSVAADGSLAVGVYHSFAHLVVSHCSCCWRLV